MQELKARVKSSSSGARAFSGAMFDLKDDKDKNRISIWKKRLSDLFQRCDTAYILAPVVILQLIFLYLEFVGGLPTGGFKACHTEECKQQIPKIIHQTYKTDKVPKNWASTPPAWKSAHPGWKYEFWTDERNRKLIEDHYSWFLPTYDAYPYGIQRSDAARYFILHKYGGVYADLDIQPKEGRHVSEIIGDADLVMYVNAILLTRETLSPTVSLSLSLSLLLSHFPPLPLSI
eukprot:1317548-Amorphochlora_amoeboformis.AAC.2